MYTFLFRFFLVVILVMSGAMTHAGMAFAAYEPVAVDDSVTAYFYDEDSVITDPEPEVVNPRGSAEAEVLKNDQFAAGSSGKTPWLINAAGERVREVKTDYLTCKVKEGQNDTIYIGCELSFDDAYSDETFRVQYVAEDTLGRFSQPATLSVYTDTFTRDEAADESFSMREARPISFNWPGTYDKESNSVCIGKDIDDLKICEDPFLVKRVVKPGEGIWRTSHTRYGRCCQNELRFVFRPEDGFQGTSDLFVRHRDSGKNRVVKYSVTVNPSGAQDDFGTLPIAYNARLENAPIPHSIAIFGPGQRGSRGALVVGGKFVNPEGSLTEEITVDGVKCSGIGPNYGPGFGHEVNCDYDNATTDTVTMKYVVIDEIDQISKPATITITGIRYDGEQCFSDVRPSHPNFSDVQWACQKKLATGWPVPGAKPQFRPALGVQRDATAAFFYRFAGSPEFTPPVTSPFSDLKPTDQHYKEITWAAAQGLTKGWDDGTFRPRDWISRAAFSAFLLRYAKETPEAPENSLYVDVPVDHPFSAQIHDIVRYGYVDPFADRYFRPDAPMDRVRAITAFSRYCHPQSFSRQCEI